MIRDSTDKEFLAKQEDGGLDDGQNPRRFCSSKAWLGLKDPRIVRISRSCGGKDRHSKVSTIRGLRDRRVRLSVPTAIQLYDLQGRLGLNQPSKVIDWLLKATEHEIDKLPPLQIPPQENFNHHHQSTVASLALNLPQAPSTSPLDKNLDFFKYIGPHSFSLFSNKINYRGNDAIVEEDRICLSKPLYWNLDAISRDKCKDVNREMIIEKSTWNRRLGQENQEGMQVHSAQVLAHNSFSQPKHSSHSSSANNALAYNPSIHWEPSNALVSHIEGPRYSSQIEYLQSSNALSISSLLSLLPRSEPLLCPSIVTPSTMVPYIGMPFNYDCKQVNPSQFQGMTSQNPLANSCTTSFYSISPPMRPVQVSMNSMHQHYQNNLEYQANPLHKGNALSSSSFCNDSKLALRSNEENLG